MESNDKESKMERLRAAGVRYREKLAAGEIERLTPTQKAKANPKSMRAAINAECYDCCGEENWINRTKFCTLFDCPFWTLRKNSKGISKQECLDFEGC